MNTRNTMIALLVCICAGGAASSAWADDLAPPDWREADRTVFAEWDTWTLCPMNPGDYLPDRFETVPETSNMNAAAWVTDRTGIGEDVLDQFQGRTDVLVVPADPEYIPGGPWELAAESLIVGVDNFSDGPEKWARIQVTVPDWQNAICRLDYWQIGDTIPTSANPIETRYYPGDFTDGWQTIVYLFEIQPNPIYEEFVVDFVGVGGPATGYVDQVVVDTICPEPASLGLLAMGGIALLRRRRR